jgi:hypothetical protein
VRTKSIRPAARGTFPRPGPRTEGPCPRWRRVPCNSLPPRTGGDGGRSVGVCVDGCRLSVVWGTTVFPQCVVGQSVGGGRASATLGTTMAVRKRVTASRSDRSNSRRPPTNHPRHVTNTTAEYNKDLPPTRATVPICGRPRNRSCRLPLVRKVAAAARRLRRHRQVREGCSDDRHPPPTP